MFPTELSVDLARTQFGLTAIYHFLFVPLTLGLSWLLVVMEFAYLRTGKAVFKDMTRFWGKLFAINFAMGVVTGVTMEFEFGQNWAYFSRFIGDTFGTALAIEGVTAFMTEATLFGLFFFTWDKVKPRTHFLITFFMAIGTNLSIVNILVANSWMQHPVGAYFDYSTVTMHLTSFVAIYTQTLAQIRIGHVMFAGAFISAMFMLGVSSYYLLKKQDVAFALRSFALATGFGLCASIFVFFLGDANGLAIAHDEPEKMAAVEGQWVTQPAPAAWYPIAFPDQAKQVNYGVIIKIPYALSLIATHSLTGTVEGVKPIIQKNLTLVREGAQAYQALVNIRSGNGTPQDIATFKKYWNVIGYGMLLNRYTDNPIKATPAQVQAAATDTIPNVFTVFWAFRVMLAGWIVCFGLFAIGAFFIRKRPDHMPKWYLICAILAIPVPYIAAEAGWVLAEVGRQPWVVRGILPTFMGSSSLPASSVAWSLVAFILFYSTLFVIEIFLMFKYGRRGPSSLGTGKYHFEKNVKH